FGAVVQVAPDLVPGGGEAGPAVQVDDPPQIPGHGFVGDIGRPGVARNQSHGVRSHRPPPSRSGHCWCISLAFTSPRSQTSPGFRAGFRRALPPSSWTTWRFGTAIAISVSTPGTNASTRKRPWASAVTFSPKEHPKPGGRSGSNIQTW